MKQEEEHLVIIKNILILHFNVLDNDFNPEHYLQDLHPDFKILGFLLELEQLLCKHFMLDIPLVENISASLHTPNDIVKLIEQIMESS